MIGMVLLESLDPVSDRRVERLTMAPTERRRLPVRSMEREFTQTVLSVLINQRRICQLGSIFHSQKA